MSTKTATPKTRKPKANNFVLVLEQFLEKYNLTASSTPKQLSEHAPKLDALLPDWMARRCVKVALARGTDNRRLFSEERIEALLPDKRKGKLTIEERAKYCAKIGDAMDIFAHHLDLGPKNDYENEIVASGSRQSQFRVKLAEGGVSSEIINTYAKDPELIQESNKIQKK
ncbi:highly derived d5-like helicase-primase: PROVISIONAL [Gigaspora margarita]|nr:highly derived d5-like helicase-primase: PROVISIONAL [Gigaspora margarita]